jgi:hypothetical protein
MKRVLAVILAVVGCCWMLTWVNSPITATAQAPARPVQWQYAVYYHSDLMALGKKTANQNLTTLGEQGWELVGITQGIHGDKGEEVTKQTAYFFKKPK